MLHKALARPRDPLGKFGEYLEGDDDRSEQLSVATAPALPSRGGAALWQDKTYRDLHPAVGGQNHCRTGDDANRGSSERRDSYAAIVNVSPSRSIRSSPSGIQRGGQCELLHVQRRGLEVEVDEFDGIRNLLDAITIVGISPFFSRHITWTETGHITLILKHPQCRVIMAALIELTDHSIHEIVAGQ